MKLLDCTLRDGGNVVGRGSNAEMTAMIIKGLIRSNVRVIEMGNCTGIGSYEANNSIAPCTDTVMDSAGTMMPQDASAYVKALKKSVKIPVAFHGHNNLGLSVANALAAHEAGADVFRSCNTP